jgi:hypothetical protein
VHRLGRHPLGAARDDTLGAVEVRSCRRKLARADRGSPTCVTCNESSWLGLLSFTRRSSHAAAMHTHHSAGASSCTVGQWRSDARQASTGVTCIFSWLGLLSFTRRSYHAAAKCAHHTAGASYITGGQWRSARRKGTKLDRRLSILVIVLFAMETSPAVHTASSSSDCLGAVLLQATLASTMLLAVRCAASLSSIGTAHVLTAPTSSMERTLAIGSLGRHGAALELASIATSVRGAEVRGAFSRPLGTALVLAPPATTMRCAAACAAYSRLGASVVMAPLASAMVNAVWCSTNLGHLGAANVLATLASTMRHAELRGGSSSFEATLVVAYADSPTQLRR